MNKKEFKKIFFTEFKEVGEDFNKNAILRKKRTLKIVNEAKSFCEKNYKAFNMSTETNDGLINRRFKKKTLLKLTGVVYSFFVFLNTHGFSERYPS